jgi:hypothetical protein
MNEATNAGRIIQVDYDPEIPVNTAWDLGYRDDTAIWWYQMVRDEIHVIDYFAGSGLGITDLCKIVIGKLYRYGKHFLPHDAKAKTLAAQGKSIIEQMAAHLGVSSMAIVPDLSVQDGIQAVRKMLPNTWFDKVKCYEGIEALRQYRREFDEDKKAFREKPLHDWCSHPCDAIRMLSIACYAEPAKDKPPDPERVLLVGPTNTVTLNDMWEVHRAKRSQRI